MKTIVAPLNFSPNSLNAARYAADMALAIQADLHLLHVVQVPFTASDVPLPENVFEVMLQSATEGLNDLQAELIRRTNAGVNIFTNIEPGAVGHRIEEFCARKNPFAVVMGISGPSLTRTLAGSNAFHAIRHLPYPLIIVPENAAFHSIKKIVLACDLDDVVAGVSVSFLKELREAFHADFDVININTESRDKQPEIAFGLDSWKERLKEVHPELHFISMDKVRDGIEKYLETSGADLLLVFPKKHHFLEFHKSQAKNIVSHSHIPVMSIHA